MDVRTQKQRMTRWTGRLFVVLSFVGSCEAQNVTETVPPLPGVYWAIERFYSPPTLPGPYLSAVAACDGGVAGESWVIHMYKFNQPGNLSRGWCALKNGYGYNSIHSYMNCPKPAVYPQRGYFFDWNTATCYRSIPASFTITLSGGTEVEPSNGSTIKTLPIIATVKDQNNQPTTNPVEVKISLKVDPTSGGHDHGDSNRPRGGIEDVETCASDSECWSNPTVNGVVEFNFNAPEAAGKYTITATCDGCSNTDAKPVDVKVDGLETIPSSSFYTFIGKTDKHSDNHYLTPEAAAILWRIAVSYQVEQQFKLRDPVTGKFTVNSPVLHVNDASLMWGGLFDISGKWTSPHFEHRRGTVVDVRANNLDTAIPEANFKEFKLLAADFGVDAHFESPSIERRHIHLRLLNREE